MNLTSQLARRRTDRRSAPLEPAVRVRLRSNSAASLRSACRAPFRRFGGPSPPPCFQGLLNLEAARPDRPGINMRIIVPVLLAFCSSAYAIDYSSSGMSCDEIGDFAKQVALQKQMKDGVTLKEAIDGLHDSLAGGDFKSTDKILAEIINEIYKRPYLSNLDPMLVKSTFEHDCEIQKK